MWKSKIRTRGVILAQTIPRPFFSLLAYCNTNTCCLSLLCFAPKNSEIMEFKKSLFCPNSPFVRTFLSLSLLFPLLCNSPFLSLSFPSITTLFNYFFLLVKSLFGLLESEFLLSPCTFLFLIYSPSRYSLYCNFPFFLIFFSGMGGKHILGVFW